MAGVHRAVHALLAIPHEVMLRVSTRLSSQGKGMEKDEDVKLKSAYKGNKGLCILKFYPRSP